MSPLPRLLECSDRTAASRAAADLLAHALRADLGRHDRASLVVSGGSTPGECFEFLAAETLDWSRVDVLPSDERWVPPEDPDSNERLVRASLLRRHASGARFLSFYRNGIGPEEAVGHIETDLAAVRRPFSAALLGMGEDGHFASLFPDFDGLEQALDSSTPANIVVVRTSASPYPRISLSLSALHDTPCPVLLFFGEEKRRVFRAARTGDEHYPVAALMLWSSASVIAVWAP